MPEFKYGIGEDEKKGKIYLSVILDLCGNRPIAIEYSGHDDNPLVFNAFDKALSANPDAKPIFHSDREYQYTSKIFRQEIVDAGMPQGMSRVGDVLIMAQWKDFGGTMKREMYYRRLHKKCPT